MTTSTVLTTIAKALHPLHDDAYNPNRALGAPPAGQVDDDRWNTAAPSHPHLRHATGAKALTAPQGDPEAARLYGNTARTIGTIYTAVSGQHRAHGDGPATPAALVSQLATISRSDLTTTQHDQLQRIAEHLAPWAQPAQVSTADPCANPRRRRRCHGHPIHADRLCRSCYDHERYLRNLLGTGYDPPQDPDQPATRTDWRATTPDTGHTNHTRVVSTSDADGESVSANPVTVQGNTATTRCASCSRGITVPLEDYQPGHTRCHDCTDAQAA